MPKLHPLSQQRICARPWNYFAINPGGDSRVCCGDWLETPIGSLRKQSVQEIWNSKEAQAIRQSVLDGSYRFCNASACPDLVKGTLPAFNDLSFAMKKRVLEGTFMTHGPGHLTLNYDPSCNLKCPTCRPEIIALRGDARKDAEAMQEKLLDGELNEARQLLITGYGDAFASPLFRKLLKRLNPIDYPELNIFLMTNGLLFDPDRWQSISASHAMIRGVSISIDAASPGVYRLNRGGDFTKLLSNLQFIKELRQDNILDYYEISFVVQANNFHEMDSFVCLGRELGCTSVLFQRLMYWENTYAREEFYQRAVHLSTHPDYHEFISALASQMLADEIVDMSNLEGLRSTALQQTD